MAKSQRKLSGRTAKASSQQKRATLASGRSGSKGNSRKKTVAMGESLERDHMDPNAAAKSGGSTKESREGAPSRGAASRGSKRSTSRAGKSGASTAKRQTSRGSSARGKSSK